ncbi:MAG: fumarylacetoacetate hydrolase family protein [Bdellovibrionaceae bacterium]|nr:fumarylacetoacetate hydrolase family protein [Pseudobdellovibrionaceae bacterium]
MIESRTEALAMALAHAEEAGTTILSPSKQEGGLTIEQAYAIQMQNVLRRMKKGERLVGFKLGLTSEEAQKHFSVFEPDFGHLFSGMLVEEGSVIDLSTLIQPKVEGELAFVTGHDLQGPGVTLVDVVRAVEWVLPAIEVIDSRIRNWEISAADTIADNASSARVVLGRGHRFSGEQDLSLMGMALSKNGEVLHTGAGAAVLENPLHAVSFLANELGKHGQVLPAGSLILSGSLSGMLGVEAGDFFKAEFDGLGSVSVRFGRNDA